MTNERKSLLSPDVAMPPPWEVPPDQRPDGVEVLAYYRGKWRHVKWAVAPRQGHLGYGKAFIYDGTCAFVLFPPKPGNEDALYV